MDYVPPTNLLVNGDMECPERGASVLGALPGGWDGVLLRTDYPPDIDSLYARITEDYNCKFNSWVEHLQGNDAWGMYAKDSEPNECGTVPCSPPYGKPFDAAIYQQVAVTPGVTYSLSGWLVSFCGGAATGAGSTPCPYNANEPYDAPGQVYILKMLGLDPTGGSDPTASTVQWVSDGRPHTVSGWSNLHLSATAQAMTMTVFARIDSPFTWHGNYGLIDAVTLVPAPVANFSNVPTAVVNRHFSIGWGGALSPAIATIPGNTYYLDYTLQYRLGSDGTWQDWLTDQLAGSQVFTNTTPGSNLTYYFRVQPLAEEPNSSGSWPHSRFPGAWTESGPVQALLSGSLKSVYLPIVLGTPAQ